MTIITLTNYAHLYIKIWDNIRFPSMEDWFGDKAVVFQNDDASWDRATVIILFSSWKVWRVYDMANEHIESKFHLKIYVGNLYHIYQSLRSGRIWHKVNF